MAENNDITMKNPSHPGGFIRTEIFVPLGLSVTEAALALGVTRPALSTFLNERAGLVQRADSPSNEYPKALISRSYQLATRSRVAAL